MSHELNFQMLDLCADGMAFGALSPCPDCSGQLTIRSHCYQCTGNISGWTKCTYTTTEPSRGKWTFPEDFMDIDCLWVYCSSYSYFQLVNPHSKKYKYKPRKRKFDQELALPQASASVDTTDGPPTKKAKLVSIRQCSVLVPYQWWASLPPSLSLSFCRIDVPLQGFKVVIIGRLGKTKVWKLTFQILPKLTPHSPQAELTQEIEALGGKVVSTVTKSTTICISDKSELFVSA